VKEIIILGISIAVGIGGAMLLASRLKDKCTP
jgi:hypothetical protein